MPGNNRYYLGRTGIKNAGVAIEWTEESQAELTKCVQSFEYFAQNYVYVIKPGAGKIRFKPYFFQLEFAKSIQENRFVIAKWPRQQGKTTIVAALILWMVLFNDNYKICILAHKKDGAKEVLERVKTAFENLPDWLQQGVVKWNDGDIRLENGSLVDTESSEAGSIRGRAFDWIYADEFAHIPPNVQTEFYKATFPVITSDTGVDGEPAKTKFTITSTPKGMDLFYKLWTESEQGKNDFVRHATEWREMPGRDEKWKESVIRQTSEADFIQEYNTEFVGSSNTLLDAPTLRRLVAKEPIIRMGDLAIWEQPIKDHAYMCCVDSAEGLNRDYHAFTITDVTTIPYKVVAVYHNNQTHHLLLPNFIYNACRMYNDAQCLIEVQSTGGQVATMLLHDLEYENIISTTLRGNNGQRIGVGAQMRLGVMTNKQVKRIGCTNLKALIEQNKLVFHDERIIKELHTFVSDKLSFRAEEGKNDDLVMTLVLFGWVVSQNYFRDTTDTDIRDSMYRDNISMIEESFTGFGLVNDHQESAFEIDADMKPRGNFQKV
jgi:hypothetical protein